MTNNHQDTIAAIATPAGMGGVGVIRVSGKDALSIAERMTGKTLTPRYAHYAAFKDTEGELIDRGVIIYFNAPHSYTGEEVVEFQGHGGVYVLQAVLHSILAHGARQARPGEFTERAFLNDKMDLVQAEAVADLIESRSQTAASAALRSLSGAFSRIVDDLQAGVIALRVYVEAALDFSDEDIDFLSNQQLRDDMRVLLDKVIHTRQQASYGQLLQHGVSVVLVGEPNAGKSSLMNRLLGHERAIVTEEAGTTRDTLEETLIIQGIPVNITDTAGLRQADSRVEKVGIARAKDAVKRADLAIWLRDACALGDEKPSELAEVDFLEVHNKADLLTAVADSDSTGDDAETVDNNADSAVTPLLISAKTGQGIEALIAAIAEKISQKHSEESVFSARERHLVALADTQKHIETAQALLHAQQTPELVAEELRLAQQALSDITGEYHSDDLLGAIFSSFCIGK